MKYRGYYIDGTAFTCKADIDAFIKERNIMRYKHLNKMLLKANTDAAMIALNNMASETAEYLVNHCGMQWSEIEALETA